MRRLALVALALVIACGADAMTSHMLIDAGELARDASQLLDAAADALSDAGQHVGDAAAQAPLETDCSHEYTYTTAAGSSTTETTQFWAELALDTASVTGIDARLCEREVLGGRDPLTLRPTPAPCKVGGEVELDPGKASVFCGQRQRVTVNGTLSESGYRFKRVTLTLRR